MGIQTKVPSMHISRKLIWSRKGQMHSPITTIYAYTSIESRLKLTKKNLPDSPRKILYLTEL